MIRLTIIAALFGAHIVQAKEIKLIQRSQKYAGYKVEEVKKETLKNAWIAPSTFKVVDGKSSKDSEDLVSVSVLGQKGKYSLTFGSVIKAENENRFKVLSVGYQVDIESRGIQLTDPLIPSGSKVVGLKDYKRDIGDYILYLEDEYLADQLSKKGVDLTSKGLRISLNDKKEIEAVKLCEEANCETLVVFDLVDLDTLQKDRLRSEEKIALSVDDNQLFGSITAIEERGVVEDVLHNHHQSLKDITRKAKGIYQSLKATFISGPSKATEGANVGSIEDVVCSSSGKAVLLDSDLKTVLAEVKTGDRLKLVQTFSGAKAPEGFMQVSLDNQNKGLILESQVSPKSACEFIAESNAGTQETASGTQSSTRSAEAQDEEVLTSAGSKKFPTVKRPSQSYRTGARAFGAGRGGGRRHAACDLYRARNEKAVAVEAGRIIQGPYYFYQGTYAREVKLKSGPVVRYGEITSKKSGAASGNFKTGDVIGYIGKTHCCTPMLHFEKYSGSKSGSLSGGGKYRRRSDLQNPTSYLQGLEKATFGKSY